MNQRPTRILLTAQARDALKAAARRSHETERGGILIGYREPATIHITDALEVQDRAAGATHYIRRSTLANQVLLDYLATADDPYLGYVGEWHTHPLPAPPSPIDRASMRLMALRNRHPVALIVAALQHDHRDVHFHGRASNPAPRLLGRHHEAPVEYD